MTDTERLAHDAGVPLDLAALVVLTANRAGVSVREFRRDCRPGWLTPHKRRLVTVARDAGFSWAAIARATNRDHKTCIYHYRKARRSIEEMRATAAALSSEIRRLEAACG